MLRFVLALVIVMGGSVAQAQERPASSLRAEIVPQVGHSSMIRSVAMSPDGKLLVSGGWEDGLRVWDAASGKLLRGLDPQPVSPRHVHFLRDGRSVLTNDDDILVVYDVSTGKQVRAFEDPSQSAGTLSLALSQDRQIAVSCGRSATPRLWDTDTGAPRGVLGRQKGDSGSNFDGCLAVAISPDARIVASVDNRAVVKLWDANSGEMLRILEHDYVRSFWGVFPLERRFRKTESHKGELIRLAFAADGVTLFSAGEDKTIHVWELATGRHLRAIEFSHPGKVATLAFSADGRLLASGSLAGSPDTLKLWELPSGRLVRTMSEPTNNAFSAAAFAPNAHTIATGAQDNRPRLWTVFGNLPPKVFEGRSSEVRAVAFSPDGRSWVTGGNDNVLRLWDRATGKLVRSFRGHTSLINAVAYSPDGRRLFSGSQYDSVRVWDVATGTELRKLGEDGIHPLTVSRANAVAVSPDGVTLLVGGDKTQSPSGERFWTGLRMWDTETGALVREFRDAGAVEAVAISPDGKLALSGGEDGKIKLWALDTGVIVRTLDAYERDVYAIAFAPDGRTFVSGGLPKFTPLFEPGGGPPPPSESTVRLWETLSGRLIRQYEGGDRTFKLAFANGGRTLVSAGMNRQIEYWDTAIGGKPLSQAGHTGWIRAMAVSPDGLSVLSGSQDGTSRLWSAETGQQTLLSIAGIDGGWLASLPTGFFDAVVRREQAFHIVRGTEITTVDQVFRSLFNPDLVREALAGDQSGEVRIAAAAIDLSRVLDSGPAPDVRLLPPKAAIGRASGSEVDVVTVAAKVTDRGRGVGRIEWRVNGITSAVSTWPAGIDEKENTIEQKLALDPGANTIEVVAYNAANLLASPPARLRLDLPDPSSGNVAVNPSARLHVLAIGIDAYQDKGWTPPGAKSPIAFPPLGLAVNDARTFATAIRMAGAGLYADVVVHEAHDRAANAASLESLIDQVAETIHPRDTVIIFAAAHGASESGRFYLIPQDYQSGPDALARRAIGQEQIQDWVGNRIKAKKLVLMFDTCESGALVGGHTRLRDDLSASEAAIGRLHEATGRPVLTAAAEGKPAFEGYQGHGVFTWALLDALKNGDRDGNGVIELSELVAHVQSTVPQIAAQVGRGRATVAARGNTEDLQSARFGSRGEDFSIVRRLR